MRVLLQRVSRASVTVEGEVTGAIERGLLALVGLGAGDTDALFEPFVEKVANLRIFNDDAGKMNLSVADVGGGILAVSQFTLYADARKGRRPSYTDAMPPAEAAAAFERFLAALRRGYGAGPIAAGRFGAHMHVELVNDGPVTIWLDSAEMPWGQSTGRG